MKSKETGKIVKFVCVFVLCAVCGFFAGKFARMGEDKINSVWGNFSDRLQTVLPFIYIAFVLVFAAVSVVLYLNVRKLEKSMVGKDDDETDEIAGKIEETVSRPILASNIMWIANFFFFAACMDVACFSEVGKGNRALYMFLPLALLLFSIAFVIVIQRQSLEIEKRINPEKSASMFDFNFNRKWLEDGDEADKIKSYKAGYMGFRAMNTACLVLCIVSFMVQLVFKTGALPIFFVCVIWGTGIISSTLAAIKSEKQGL